MAATTFPSIDADYGASKKAQPNVRVAQFGSGYSQRSTFGINQDPKIWDLSWVNRTATDANIIEDFLEARGGAEAFNWSHQMRQLVTFGFVGHGQKRCHIQTYSTSRQRLSRCLSHDHYA